MNTVVCRLILVVTCMAHAGCFYLVEAGKGGVAERYGINERTLQKEKIAQRLKHCYDMLAQHRDEGMTRRYPTLYQQVQQMLVLAKRYHGGEYYHMAHQPLHQAEVALKHLDSLNQPSLQTANTTCQHSDAQELCI